MKYVSSFSLVVAVLVGTAGSLSAQDWSSPMFLPPTPSDNLGAYFVSPEGGDWGLLGLWRQSGRIDLGLRAGILDSVDDVAVALGVDASDRLLEADDDRLPLPVDVAWVLGFGATINDSGDGTAIRVPAGVSLGRAFEAEDWTLVPYAVPRATFLARADDDDTDLDVGLNIDLAADLVINERWLVRGGITLGADDAVGIGVAFRTDRPARVTSRSR